MKEYMKPILEEEKVVIEDIIALSLGGETQPDNDDFFGDLNSIPKL